MKDGGDRPLYIHINQTTKSIWRISLKNTEARREIAGAKLLQLKRKVRRLPPSAVKAVAKTVRHLVTRLVLANDLRDSLRGDVIRAEELRNVKRVKRAPKKFHRRP